MSSVEFDEEKSFSPIGRAPVNLTGTKMGDWMMRRGIVKSPTQANVILVAIMIVMFVASAAVLVFGTSLRQTVFPERRTPRAERVQPNPEQLPQ